MSLDHTNAKLRTRKTIGWLLLLSAVLIWLPSSDVIDLIIRNREVVFGRYSRGQFGSLFFLSLLLIGGAAMCFSRIQTASEMILVSVMVVLSVSISGFILVVGSGIAISISGKARYIEKMVEGDHAGVQIKGIVRHRPPNEFYQLPQVDKPVQQRSYPDAPPGYPTFNLTLTTDQYGFRNPTSDGKLLDEYPVLAVGDSYVAGSQVSDDQGWVSLLSKQLNTPIYNLGVSGADPGNYLNNFVLLGRQFKPKLVLFMIYEGNDFKEITPAVFDLSLQQKEKRSKKNANKKHENKERDKKKEGNKKTLGEKIIYWTEASPVTKGLERLSLEVLEAINKDEPVPGYAEKVGFMPIKVSSGGRDHYYSFEPKRLTYLYEEKETFKQKANWKRISSIMQTMVDLGKQDGYTVLFLYAPSTPHVVMPLVKDVIPAEQLRNFTAYQEDDLPEADVFKKNVFDWMDNEEEVFLEHCAEQQWQCLALTKPLREATAQGEQLYYTYDQHWTPDGNRVVANAVRELATSALKY